MNIAITNDMLQKLAMGVGGSLVCSVWVWFAIRTNQFLKLITRGAVPFHRRTIWLLKLCAIILGAGTVWGILAEFGIPSYLAVVPAGIVVALALRDKVESFVPANPPQDSTDYEAAWQEYRHLRRAHNQSGLLSLAAFFFLGVTIVIGGQSPNAMWLSLEAVSALAFLIFLAISAQNQLKWKFWPCPRCGHAFRGYWGFWMPKRCAHCSLPRPEKNVDLGAVSRSTRGNSRPGGIAL